MRSFITLTLHLLILLIFNVALYGQQEKVRSWNPTTSSFILKDFSNNPDNRTNKELTDSIWHSIGPSNNDILGFDFGNDNSNIIYAASRDSGVFKTTNGGSDWNQINNGIADNFIRSIAVHPQNGDIILAGTFLAGLYRTADGGQTWNSISQVDALSILDITFDKQYGDTVYVGTISKGVYRSWDAGITWQHLFPDTITTNALEVIVDPQFTNIIYYSDPNEQQVYKSTDYGNTWNLFFEGNIILSLAVDHLNSNIIYMGAQYDSLYKSINGGQTWDRIPINNNSHIVEDILIDFDNVNNVYLATVTGGVFRSTDGGLTWSELNTGLTVQKVLQLKFHPLTTLTMYASTNGGAIFMNENLVTGFFESKKAYPNDFLLFQNYPNPFNPTTTIKYDLPLSSLVLIQIFNNLGEKVKTLYSGLQTGGNHKIVFDGSSLTSGIYFYQITTRNFTQTKKCLLLK
jgi:photosystem II stability/assembly factor-like uncharacterized protein